jgi:hypothetical protein
MSERPEIHAVRFAAPDVPRVREVLGMFPGASFGLIVRALLHSATKRSITNALCKYNAHKLGGHETK